jgi:PIN domain nuclease of toxin-antitoxin system
MSAINVWELHVKTAIGKLALPEPVSRFVSLLQTEYDITSLALRDDDLEPLATLPMRHRDPFDRALIAQSISRKLLFVTPDPAIRAYPEVRTAW